MFKVAGPANENRIWLLGCFSGVFRSIFVSNLNERNIQTLETWGGFLITQ